MIDCGPCVLRPWRRSDAASLARHADDIEIWRNLRDLFPHPYTPKHARAYIARAMAADPVLHLAMEVDGEAVGGIGLAPGEDVERISAEMGYWLGRAYWGRGITSAAVRGATAYAFRELRLVRVYATPYAHNTASARVLEKAGFRLEGRLRRNALKEGRIVDSLLYAITDEDLKGAGYG